MEGYLQSITKIFTKHKPITVMWVPSSFQTNHKINIKIYQIQVFMFIRKVVFCPNNVQILDRISITCLYDD